jgi:hypothetical protein
MRGLTELLKNNRPEIKSFLTVLVICILTVWAYNLGANTSAQNTVIILRACGVDYNASFIIDRYAGNASRIFDQAATQGLYINSTYP